MVLLDFSAVREGARSPDALGLIDAMRAELSARYHCLPSWRPEPFQLEVLALYRTAGYRRTAADGRYAGNPEARCFEKSVECGPR